MHQRLNLQVQATMEELEEDQEFLEIGQYARRLPTYAHRLDHFFWKCSASLIISLEAVYSSIVSVAVSFLVVDIFASLDHLHIVYDSLIQKEDKQSW